MTTQVIAPYTPPTGSLIHQAIAVGINLIRARGDSPTFAAGEVSRLPQFREIDIDTSESTPLLSAGPLARAIERAIGL